MNVIIVTAREGRGKHKWRVRNKELIRYPVDAAAASLKADLKAITTDCVWMKQVAQKHGFVIINRPAELAGDTVNHGDVIEHAVDYIGGDNFVVLLGNTVMVDKELIDLAFLCLEKVDCDSVMTVWEATDDHPYRALKIEDGFLRSFEDREVDTNRQSYPKAYYYDQGIWAFKRECLDNRDGPSPWWWMGKKCVPLKRPWVTGRDIHNEMDIEIAEWWSGLRRL